MCVKRAYVPESNSPYIVNRVCIHMSLRSRVCVCARFPCVDSLLYTQALLYCSVCEPTVAMALRRFQSE